LAKEPRFISPSAMTPRKRMSEMNTITRHLQGERSAPSQMSPSPQPSPAGRGGSFGAWLVNPSVWTGAAPSWKAMHRKTRHPSPLFPLPQGEGKGEGEGNEGFRGPRTGGRLSLTSTLSRWERGIVWRLVGESKRLDRTAPSWKAIYRKTRHPSPLFPLPQGEGKGEGERVTNQPG